MSQSPPVRAGIYLRISRDPLDTRTGVGRQLKDCSAIAADLNWDVVEVFDENNTSATRNKNKRVQYLRYIDWVKTGKLDAIVFWEFDRYTRDPREADDLLNLARDHGLRAASSTEEGEGQELDLLSPNGRHNIINAGSSARRETEMLSKRLRKRFDQKAADGEPHGFVPYGWRRVRLHDDRGNIIGSRDELNPDEAGVVRDAANMILSGRSLRSTVAEINSRGLRTLRGNAWNSTTLRQMLLRERNAGLRRHRGQTLGPGKWPPIITPGEYDRVVALLTDPTRKTSKGAIRKHLLTGIARCGRDGCAGTMVVNVGRVTKGKRQPPAYVCSLCTRIRRKQEAVDEVVEGVMIARLSRPDALIALATGDPEEVERSRAEIQALAARMEIAADQFADGLITGEQLARITGRLKPQIERARGRIQSAMPEPGIAEMVGVDVEARWVAAPLDVKRTVIELLCTVTILPSGPGKSFDPNLIHFTWRSR